MEVEVKFQLNGDGDPFQYLYVDGAYQGKVGPISDTVQGQITCEMILELIERAWDAGMKNEPLVPSMSFEEDAK